MTLEEAAEKVLREEAIKFLESAARNWRRLPPLCRDDLVDVGQALRMYAKSYGDQRFIEGATAMREMAEGAAHTEWFSGDRHRYASQLGPDIQSRIRKLDPNQLKDTDHG